jgi:hypothetical protein
MVSTPRRRRTPRRSPTPRRPPRKPPKAAKEAEKERAQAENDVDEAPRDPEAEEHNADRGCQVAERDAARERGHHGLQEQLNNVRVENAFNNSKFITDETILTGAQAQRLFGDYVDVVDGQAVVYDAPRGDEKRAKVMDSKGNALPFNDAIAKVINADPDKDSLLKSKTKPGTGSKTVDGKPKSPWSKPPREARRRDRALREKNASKIVLADCMCVIAHAVGLCYYGRHRQPNEFKESPECPCFVLKPRSSRTTSWSRVLSRRSSTTTPCLP